MQDNELKPHINIESLGALLPEEDRTSLEERYLSHKEVRQNSRFSVLIMMCTMSGHTELNRFYFLLSQRLFDKIL